MDRPLGPESVSRKQQHQDPPSLRARLLSAASLRVPSRIRSPWQSVLSGADADESSCLTTAHTPDTFDSASLTSGRKRATPGSLEQWRLDKTLLEEREVTETARFYGWYQRSDGARYEGEFLDADRTVQDGLGIFSW